MFEFGAEGTWSNTPTVTYQPVLGDRFTKSLLQPVPPAAVFQLLQGGWPADLVLQAVVGSINGLRNASGGIAGDPGFRKLAETLTRIRRAGGLGIWVDTRKGGSAVVIVLRPWGTAIGPGEDGRRVRELLRMAEDIGEFEVTYGLFPRSRREVAMLSRSMLKHMLEMDMDVELPAAHAADGRVSSGRRQAGDAQATALVRIRSGTDAPADIYTAVPYKDHWYWIDDTDFASKRVFTFLLILFSFDETGQTSATPIVTVPSR